MGKSDEKVVKALASFTRSDIGAPVKRGDVFTCAAGYADELVKVGNAIETKMAPEPEKKTQSSGARSSASQAGRASQTSKSSSSKTGGSTTQTKKQ